MERERKSCMGCGERAVITSREVRVYERRRQEQFKIQLCVVCWGGMRDLLCNASVAIDQRPWNPLVRLTPADFVEMHRGAE